MDSKWREVAITLRHWTLRMNVYTPFTYRGLVEFLLWAEHRINHTGSTSFQRSAIAAQLVQTELIQPVVSQHLPTIMAERN